MKYKLVAVLFVFCFTFGSAYSQPGAKMQRIHAAKVAYITDRLQLTEDQTISFLPVYREYEKELMALRKQYKPNAKGGQKGEMDDTTAMQYLEDDLDFQQKVIELKRKYNDRFLKTISAKQLAQLHVAEREFRQMLLKRLQQRPQDGGAKYRR